MRGRPSPIHRRTHRIARFVTATVFGATALGLVMLLPLERAAVVAGMVSTVAASAAPAWLSTGRSSSGPDRRHPPDAE